MSFCVTIPLGDLVRLGRQFKRLTEVAGPQLQVRPGPEDLVQASLGTDFRYSSGLLLVQPPGLLELFRPDRAVSKPGLRRRKDWHRSLRQALLDLRGFAEVLLCPARLCWVGIDGHQDVRRCRCQRLND